MTLPRDPTVTAALIIAGGMMLTGIIVAFGLRRQGRGLGEMARALTAFTATVDQHNLIARKVKELDNQQASMGETLALADGTLREWYPLLTWLRLIPILNSYLTKEDGDRYTEWRDGPAQHFADGPTGEHVTDDQEQGPDLPFDPRNPDSVERYLLTIVHEAASRANIRPYPQLDDPLPPEFSEAMGGYARQDDTWRRWAVVKAQADFGVVLGPDATHPAEDPGYD